MLFGTYMGVFWILKFILFPLGLKYNLPFLSFLFMGLTLCVPFMGYYYLRIYRNQVCGGAINFLPAWLFTVSMYIFSALLTAVAHYIYFRYIDHGFILDTYENLLSSLSASNVPVAMLKVFAFYCVFTPVSTIAGSYLADTLAWNEYLVTALNMVANFILEYLYDRLVVFRKSLDTNALAKKGSCL